MSLRSLAITHPDIIHPDNPPVGIVRLGNALEGIVLEPSLHMMLLIIDRQNVGHMDKISRDQRHELDNGERRWSLFSNR